MSVPTLVKKFPTLLKNPCPLVGLLVPVYPVGPVRSTLCSSSGLDNCKPICLAINRGPFGKSVKNLLIRRVSTTDAPIAPTIPPLIKPSSNLVNLSLLIPLSTVLMSVLI